MVATLEYLQAIAVESSAEICGYKNIENLFAAVKYRYNWMML